MGVDTKLYINSNHRIEDIVTIIEKHGLGINPRIDKKHTSMQSCWIHLNAPSGARSVFVYLNNNTPLGACTSLSLSHDKEAIEIMRGIANVLGGFFEKNDCSGEMEMITGSISQDDGIPYFVKSALINNVMKADRGINLDANDDIDGLIQHIKDWKARHGSL